MGSERLCDQLDADWYFADGESDLALSPAELCSGCPALSQCQLDALRPINISEIVALTGGSVMEGEDDIVYQSGCVRGGCFLDNPDGVSANLAAVVAARFPAYYGNCTACHKPMHKGDSADVPIDWVYAGVRGRCLACDKLHAPLNEACNCCGRHVGEAGHKGGQVRMAGSTGLCEACHRVRVNNKPLTPKSLAMTTCAGCKKFRLERNEQR